MCYPAWARPRNSPGEIGNTSGAAAFKAFVTSKLLNLVVIGCGRIGRLHAENIATRLRSARLSAVADVNLSAARETAARLNVPRASENYSELLADASIDAIAICSATNTHAQII